MGRRGIHPFGHAAEIVPGLTKIKPRLAGRVRVWRWDTGRQMQAAKTKDMPNPAAATPGHEPPKPAPRPGRVSSFSPAGNCPPDDPSSGCGPCPKLLLHHPAGPFFALAGLVALGLPWLWLLPLEDAAMTHRRFGLFGLGGGAVVGYVLTALPAWTPRPVPLRLAVLVLLWLVARGAALVAPWAIWPGLLPQLGLGLALLWPLVQQRASYRWALAAVPLAMAGAEAGLVAGLLSPRILAAGLGLLILLVGGRAIPAFLRAEAERTGTRPPPAPLPLWPFAALWPVAMIGPLPLRLAAGLAVGGLILLRMAPAMQAGAANRMLATPWAMLAPIVPLLALSETGPAALAAEHLLLVAVMGGTVLAFAARAAMHRPPDGGLRPHALHRPALWLVLLAAPLRGLAALTATGPAGVLWLGLSGAAWSLGWALFLAVHLAALPCPAPFPVLSAARGLRPSRTGQTARHSPAPHGR